MGWYMYLSCHNPKHITQYTLAYLFLRMLVRQIQMPRLMVELSTTLRREVISNFPSNIRVPYEMFVSTSHIMGNIGTQPFCMVAVPKGKRMFMWITDDLNVYFLEPGRNNKIGSVYSYPTIHTTSEYRGTIISGFLSEIWNPEVESEEPAAVIFVIDDIYMHKGIILYTTGTGGESVPDVIATKTGYLHNIVSILREYAPLTDGIDAFAMVQFGLSNNMNNPDNAGYPVRHYQIRATHQILPYYNVAFSSDKGPSVIGTWPYFEEQTLTTTRDNSSVKLSDNVRRIFHAIDATESPIFARVFKPVYQSYAVFMVQADIAYDVYKLFCVGSTNRSNKGNTTVSVKTPWVFYQYALIPNLPSSVLMNTLFRNIRENANLDYIEESDDECDNNHNIPSNDNHERRLLMECSFDWIRKKWIPYALVDFNQTNRVPHISQL